LNATLNLGAGSATFPGLPVLTTPAFTISTAGTFSQVLVTDTLDLGFIALHGRLLFERQNSVFRLSFTQPNLFASPSLEIKNLITVALPTFVVASDGTFSIDAAFPKLGIDSFHIVGASVHLAKTGAALTTVAGQITGGKLLVVNAAPITLPTLDFG